MNAFPLLSAIAFLPLFCGLLLMLGRGDVALSRKVALGATLVELLLVVSVPLQIALSGETFSGRVFMEDAAWIDSLGMRYSLMMDGVSYVLILLTSFLSVLCVLVSWTDIRRRAGSFYFCLLAMQTGVVGVFLSSDLFLFYLFWELQLIPMFFLIGIWGHERRIFATVKFVMFSMAGSLLMLVALIALHLIHGQQTDIYTFSLFELVETRLSASLETWLYAAFLLAFAIKIPMLPVHTWLPDAHTEAPTAGSVILAGLLLKTGVYALFRFAFPLFPTAAARSAPLLLMLGLAGIFYAAWIAFAQEDAKRMVAYSSIAHMGLIVVGLAIPSITTWSGAVLQMVNHGLTTSALFIMVGMLDERAHSRSLRDFGGLWSKMPVFSAFFLLFAMATLGLPGLNNFVGEVLILVGAFQTRPLVGIIGLCGIVFTLAYTLRLVQDTLFGQSRGTFQVWDVTAREAFILVPLALGVIALGLYPAPLLAFLQNPLEQFLEHTLQVLAVRAVP